MVLLLLHIALLWFLVSLHVVGGAVLFRRLFPRESPWFGFVVPVLALVLLTNFIEHSVGLATLQPALLVTSAVCLWAILNPRCHWRGLRLPTGIFLVAFAFTLAQRAVKPSILDVSSGLYDLPLLASYCMGEKVPPALDVFPPFSFGHYYALVHYAASVLTRLLGVDVGTGFNLSSALMSAWLCVLVTGIAWSLSRGRIWITIAAALSVECAASGSLPYLWWSNSHLEPPDTAALMSTLRNPDNQSPVIKLLKPIEDDYAHAELEIPGYWSWLGTYHATNGGQFLTLFSALSLVELFRRRRTDWPWIGLIACPLLMLVTSTWGVPLVGVLTVAGLSRMPASFSTRREPKTSTGFCPWASSCLQRKSRQSLPGGIDTNRSPGITSRN